MTIVLAKAGLQWEIVQVMKAGYVAVVVAVGIMGECQSVCAQGLSEQKRSVSIITPGSLYKNRTFNQNSPGTSNNANPSANRSSSTATQNTAAQTLSKPMTLGTVQQPSAAGTMPKVTASPISSFTSSYTPGQSTPLATQQQPLYGTGQQFPAQRPAFSSAPLGNTFSTPMTQPSYLMSPQFAPASPSFSGGQPNATVKPPAKPIYTMNPPANTSQPFSSGNSLMTGLQRTPPLQLSPMSLSPSSLSTPLTTPLITPLTQPQQQPLSVPESPYLQPTPARR